MKNLILLPLVALMFLATSCNDSLSQQDIKKAKINGQTPTSTPPTSLTISIDGDLDDDFMYSSSDAINIVEDMLDEMNIIHPNLYNNVTIETIYSDHYIPDIETCLKLIDWYGNPFEDTINNVLSLSSFSVPSVYYYVINFPNDSGYAVVHADKRIPTPVAYYRDYGSLNETDFDFSSLAYYITTLATPANPDPNSPTLSLLQPISWTNIPAGDNRHNQLFSYYYQLVQFILSLYPCQYGNLDYPCEEISLQTYSCVNILTTHIENYGAWNDDYPYISPTYSSFETNIPLTIMKILTHEGFVGTLFNTPFDGTDFSSAHNVSQIAAWTDLIFEYLCADPTKTYTERGLQFLEEECSFTLSNPTILERTTINYTLWEPYHYIVSGLHVGIIPKGNNWDLLVGLQAYYDDCNMLWWGNFYVEEKDSTNNLYHINQLCFSLKPVIFYELCNEN